MALELQGITRASNCNCEECIGGIVEFCVTDFCLLEDIPIDAEGCISGLPVLDAGGTWGCYEHDADDTANYTQTVEIIGTRTKRINHSMFAKFACLDKSVILEANRLKKCCNPVVAIKWANGLQMLLGVDIIENSDGTFRWEKSVGQTNLLPSIISGTTAEEDRLELTIESTSRCFAGVFTDGIDLSNLPQL